MNGETNENVIVTEYEFDNPPIQKIDSLIDTSIRDCNNKYFHTIDHICEYDLNFTNITNNESVNFTISDKSKGMYELNKKLSLARERGFKFNQINNFKMKIYSNLFCINIHYHLKLGASIYIVNFSRIFYKIVIIFELIVMTIEIHFILHVTNGIHIIIQVYIHEFIYKY